ncbi:hypothetical protein GGS21DRAFT_545241 [Xylaria nigripes]|nr:hypothetical protein GGS21DRAFT_545241 [Xylaria nigripes]
MDVHLSTASGAASGIASGTASDSDSASTSVPPTTSPSGLSFHARPSHTSEQNISPFSTPAPNPAATICSSDSSPLIDLSVVDEIVRTPRTSLHEHKTEEESDSGGGSGSKIDDWGVNSNYTAQSINMDKNAFQSVNERRNKLASERLVVSQFQHAHQLASMPQAIRSGIQTPGSHRSLTSVNWRTDQTDELTQSQPGNLYNAPFDPASQHLPHPSIRTTPSITPSLDQHNSLQHGALTSYPNFGYITDAQLDDTYSYCYDRGNGQYTRLIPADMLPPLQHIPAIQQSCAGMVVVPQPRGFPPNGHSSNTELVTLQDSSGTPTMHADPIQSQIDNIVAAVPPTPARAPSGHQGAGHSTSSGAPPGQRRPKVYCDKWVHEGVCAFTQQGCKYKHEMPTDKATQHQLGLFHGFPQWWKKHQADLGRQRDVTASAEALDSGGLSNDPRSNNERYLGRTHSAVGIGGSRVGGSSLPSDTSGQLSWQRRGEHNGNAQGLGPPPSVIGRVNASRNAPPAMRNHMATSTPNNSLSPCSVTYSSPFGPIAPPARSHAVGISHESLHGSSMTQSSVESQSMSQHTRGNPLVGSNMATAPMTPGNDPYASLCTFDDSDGRNANEAGGYSDSPGLGEEHWVGYRVMFDLDRRDQDKFDVFAPMAFVDIPYQLPWKTRIDFRVQKFPRLRDNIPDITRPSAD